jgi:hypothetical protein
MALARLPVGRLMGITLAVWGLLFPLPRRLG